MAHVGRRHRNATPDDFVPGLIHHFPSDLPSASALPKLPDCAISAPSQDTESARPIKSPFSLTKGQVRPFNHDPSPKTVSLVSRKCFSQKKPLPNDYAKTKGALAAIGAILENAQRERLSARAIPTSNLRRSIPDDEDANTNESSDPIRGSAQQGLYHSLQAHSRPLLDLLDVVAKKKRAERQAKNEIEQLINSGQAVSDRPKIHRFWTRSHSGESDSTADSERKTGGAWYQERHRQRVVTNIQGRMFEVSDDSDSATGDEGSDTASATSSYVPRRRETTGSIQPIRIRTRMSR